jgi:putative membrane protein
MMAWIRTATSLISFGFSIYKFFQLEPPRRAEHAHLIGPREFAIILVSIGLLSLLMATIQYRQQIRNLRM